MGFRNGKRGSQYKPRPPKGPVKLAFGIVAPKGDPNAIVPVAKPVEVTFARQEIIGTLTKKGIKINDAPTVPESHIKRILFNLEKIYSEGKHSSSRSIIDFKEGELLAYFPFDQGVIERIKGFDRNERAWDADLKCWRIFPGAFDDLFDVLGRGFKITDVANEALKEVIESKYYAHVAKSKFGKLIIRESWFKEFESDSMPVLAPAYGSNAWLNAPDETILEQRSKEINSIKKSVDNFDFKRKPFSHQLSGIEYLLANPEAALLDEMGCGKSYQIASALGILFKNKEIDRALIVAPMSLLRTWQEELKLATDIPFTVIVGTQTQRQKALASKTPIFIIHYEGLRIEEEHLGAWLQKGKGVLVFDESQRIKNLTALTTMAALRVRPLAQRCYIATGTPIANRPIDLFSQYLVVDNGRTFGKKFQEFKNKYCEMEIKTFQVGRKTIRKEQFVGVRNGPELRERILKTSLRRLKSDVLDLPPILFKDYVVELKTEQKAMYNQMRDNLRIEVSKMAPKDVVATASSIAVQLLRLSQIASNPKLLDNSYDGSNAKLKELKDLLEDILADETKKVILWSHYVANVHALMEEFVSYNAVGHTGEMAVDDRQKSVSSFQDDPTCRLFIATPQSAKEGLTLVPRDGKTQADTMIYVDLNFDSGSYVQSQARFHRIGQSSEHCLVIHLVGESTVDEYIRRAVVDKIATASQILDDNGVINPAFTKQNVSFSKDELLEIL